IPSLTAARLEVPAAVDAIYQRMVAKKPADRYPSMQAVLADLEPLAPAVGGDRPSRAPASSAVPSAPPAGTHLPTPVSGPKPALRPPIVARYRRRRRRRRLILSVIVAVLVGAGFALWSALGPSPTARKADSPRAQATRPTLPASGPTAAVRP